jgi:hypothetical protein
VDPETRGKKGLFNQWVKLIDGGRHAHLNTKRKIDLIFENRLLSYYKKDKVNINA